jgi:lipopolysaccharide export system protein LptA
MPHNRTPAAGLAAAAAALIATGLAAVVPVPAHAERADRGKPLNIEADGQSRIDLLQQTVVFNGNVVATKGTMIIRAARLEARETPDGYRTIVAIGSRERHATYRQKRDAPDEWVEGDAERLEYDSKSDVVRFVTNASVRRLRGTQAADEISGNLVTYNATTETFDVTGGGTPTASNPGQRVRATLTPREGTPAAAEARAAASGAAPAASNPVLRTAPALPEPRR